MFFGTLWTLGNFPCQRGDRTDFQTINPYSCQILLLYLFHPFQLVSNHLPNFSPIPFTQNQPKSKIRIRCCFSTVPFFVRPICSSQIKNCLPSCGRLAFEPCERYRLRRDKLWRPFRDFQTTRIHGKKGEISWKWSRKTYNYIDFRRNLCFLLILINSYVINIDVFVL